MATNDNKRGKNSKLNTTTTKTNTRKDSLIKGYSIVESDLSVYKNKIIFVTVRDIPLVYYTNTVSFMESLENFKEKFIISYEFARGTQSTIDGERIIKVKLPKLPKGAK